MVSDPLYRHIAGRLSEPHDGDLFEQCVVDLLREIWPGIAPVRGGSDAGMDGAIADGRATPIPLVCTTENDVIGNLTRSLQSYTKDGGSRRQAVLATSQALTPRRRRNLEKRASQLGFVLLQIHDHSDLVDRLYRNPLWCRELLGLVGDPPALSALPVSDRPVRGDILIGRDDDLQWLRAGRGDLLLVGQPGSGKTFLLRELTKTDGALFVVDWDRGRIARGLRDQKPRILLVDDAHDNPDAVTMLCHLRKEVGADFRIIASSWPGAEADVASRLGIDTAAIRHLRLLTRDEILQVVKNAGIAGPNPLLRELVDQSVGRPGLAVTLSHLCLSGDIQRVALGDALAQDTRRLFERFVGKDAMPVLAAFSVGGECGMAMDSVAEGLGRTVVEIRHTVTQLAAGGIIHEAAETLVVLPDRLRHALVRDTFFAGPTSLPLDPFIAQAPDQKEVLLTLIGARASGGRGHEQLIKDLLLRCRTDEPWRAFASIGKGECRWALENGGDGLHSLVWPALRLIPDESMTRLLTCCADDSPSATRIRDSIREWVASREPGSPDALAARRILLRQTAAWHKGGGSPSVAIGAVCTAMSPSFGDSQLDPGSGQSVTLRQGYLTLQQLRELQALWPEALEVLRRSSVSDWKPVQQLIQSWAHPHLSRGALPDETYDAMRRCAAHVLTDAVGVAQGHVGFLRWAQDAAEDLGVRVPPVEDEDFSILYPRESRRDWRAQMERHEGRARQIGRRWAAKNPASAAAKLASYQRLAEEADIRWPRLAGLMCHEIASSVEKAQEWAHAFMEADLPADLVRPFLEAALKADMESALALMRAALAKPALRSVVVAVALPSSSIPESFVTEVISELDASLADTVHMLCRSAELADDRLELLLRHRESAVASAAALGEWHRDPQGSIRSSLQDIWRETIIRSVDDGYGLEEIFQSDPSVAFDWIRRRIASPLLGPLGGDTEALAAIACLSMEHRRRLLHVVPGDFYRESWIRELVGDDMDLIRALLKTDLHRSVRLAPLKTSRFDECWCQKACAAHDACFSSEEIAHASLGNNWGWSGKESDMWAGWVSTFETLIDHPDLRIREIGKIGAEWTRDRMTQALEREQREDVYGS